MSEFDPTGYWYIKIIPGEKNPTEKWGGYSQKFEEAKKVYSHTEVVESDHDHWGIVDRRDDKHVSRATLIFDLDIHKAPDDFDPSDVTVGEDTLVVKSQSGGLHVYFAVTNAQRGEGSESDFEMVEDLGWDIDFRGSYVSHHVVAPNDIPGVEGDYEIVGDESVTHVTDPGDAASAIRYDGEPLIKFNQDTGIGDFEWGDRPAETPDEMPTCYHSGLELRKAAPDDHPNTHKVNVLTAQCGLAAGYDPEEVVDHFVNEYAPGDECDVGKTEYQVDQIYQREYAPPSISTLRDWGILDEDETCDCPIDYHGGDSTPKLDITEAYERDEVAGEEAAAVAGAETDGGTATSDGGAAEEKDPIEHVADEVDEAVRNANDDVIQHKTARHRIASSFVRHFDFVFPEDEVRGWRSTLYVYEGIEGIYEPRGESFVERKLERVAGDYVTNTVVNEIIGKIKRMTTARGEQFMDAPNRLVVENGILDLHTGDLDPHTPNELHRTKLDVAWNPDAGEPDEIDSFFHDIVEPTDVDTLYRLIAHTLYKEYVGEKAAMLVGGGKNGKSVFLDLVERFLGDFNVSHRALQDFDGNRFAANQLQGKMANIHPDMGDESVTDMSTFKKLTGRDTMTADVKYESPVTFENYATLMFAANEMPVFGEDNHAVWRRWLYINFPNTFDERDPDAKDPEPKRLLMRRLTDEEQLEALLVRCQREIQHWYTGREWYPDAMDAEGVREQMKKAAEPVFDFATTCLREADEDSYLLKEDVRAAYREYATQEGLPKLTAEGFGENLLNLTDFSIESGRRRVPEGNQKQPTVYNGVEWSPRGRQVAGVDEHEDENQSAIGDGKDLEKVMADLIRDLVEKRGGEPVSVGMVVGKATNHMGLEKAQHTLDTMRDRGDVYTPADADENEIMLTEGM